MAKTTQNSPKQMHPRIREKQAPVPAQQRCRAVLSLWSQQRTPSAICREYGVQWTVLNSWQDRALEGMLGALQPRGRQQVSVRPALPTRLEKLLAKRLRKGAQKTSSSPEPQPGEKKATTSERTK